ncbi:mitochondrial phosphate carrier protein 3, mitochondrial-like protein, partial [Tanacetum coccineum]
MRGLFKGWSPTLVGYAAQGACWFGFYEFFKKYYLDISGLEYAGLILLAAPSSAEVIASTVLCPMEAVKVRVQTQPGFARGLVDGLPKFVISEGALDTMINLPSCEFLKVVFFKDIIGKPENECSIPLQIYGSFDSGFSAGILSASILNSRAILLSFSATWKAAKAAKKVGYRDIQKLRSWPLHQQIFMNGILSGIQWGIYDSFKMSYGLPQVVDKVEISKISGSGFEYDKVQPLIPHFLYSSHSPGSDQHNFMIPAPNEPLRKMEMYSPRFYATCAVGGMLSCGLTHLAYTPLNLVKSKMLMDPLKYTSVSSCFKVLLLKEQGVWSLFKGWSPTLIGYGAQGACRFGFYEFFKKYYSDVAGPEYATKYPALIYMAASSSAEVIASIALCPMEAVKVRVQTQPGFARGLVDGLPKLYKGLVPLWRHQIPYTMINFSCFEISETVRFKYKLRKRKNECSKSYQVYSSFKGGFLAGSVCAFAFPHCADELAFIQTLRAEHAVKKVGAWDVLRLVRPQILQTIIIGILTGVQWGMYDAFKLSFGLPASGGMAKVEISKTSGLKNGRSGIAVTELTSCSAG